MAIFCSPQCEEYGAMCSICFHFEEGYLNEIWRFDIEYRDYDFCTKWERRIDGATVGMKCFMCPVSGGVDWKDRPER